MWFGWSGRIVARRVRRAAHRAATATSTYVHGRPVARGLRRLLQRLRQPHAVAAAAFPPRPGRLQPRDLRRLSPRQRAVRRAAGAAAARRRPDLGARLPPDSARRQLLREHRRRATASASSCTCRCRRRTCWRRCRSTRDLFEALSAYDLVGFQTERDLERFQRLRAPVRRRHGDRGRAAGTPGGRAAAAPARSRSASTPRSIARRPRRRREARGDADGCARAWPGARWRSASTGWTIRRACPKRFRAFERCSTRIPELRGSITFLQIAPPSRGDVRRIPRAARANSKQLAGHINGRHAAAGLDADALRQPRLPHGVLTGFYRWRGVGLVTPLRDGMNLVAKEYVAAQDPDDPGVLVLSRFAGAARETDDSACW